MHYISFTGFLSFSIFIIGHSLDNQHSALQMRQSECLQKVTKELETRYRVLQLFLHFFTLPVQKKTAKLHAPISYSCTVILSLHKVELWEFKILLMPPLAWTISS